MKGQTGRGHAVRGQRRRRRTSHKPNAGFIFYVREPTFFAMPQQSHRDLRAAPLGNSIGAFLSGIVGRRPMEIVASLARSMARTEPQMLVIDPLSRHLPTTSRPLSFVGRESGVLATDAYHGLGGFGHDVPAALDALANNPFPLLPRVDDVAIEREVATEGVEMAKAVTAAAPGRGEYRCSKCGLIFDNGDVCAACFSEMMGI